MRIDVLAWCWPVLEESSTNVLKGATGRKSEHLFLGLVETRGAAVVLDESKPLPNRVNWRLVLRSASVIRHGKQHKEVRWPLPGCVKSLPTV